ncbi:hypothetical protein [Paraburkholderia sp. BR14262]|uniref:hypothetical protein n=1 Tax=Paraburkholderia sp. BR14262 TaxID=3236999 RepID=UPI0034CDD846
MPLGTSEEHTHMVLRCFAIYGENSPAYVIEEVRRKIEDVLSGWSWRFAFPLPWLPGPKLKEILTPSAFEQAHLDVAVRRLMIADPTLTVSAARERVSVETGKDIRTIERAQQRMRNGIEHRRDDDLDNPDD